MLTFAVAALAMSPLAKRQTTNYILPLYDLVTSVNTTDGLLTMNFSLSANWVSGTNNFANFKVFYVNGDLSHFSPNGSWNDITSATTMNISGNTATFYYDFANNTPQGTVWIQYAGTSSDSPWGAETSFIAAQFGSTNQAGHGSLPGAIVPIIYRAPDSNGSGSQNNYNVPISFTIESPWSSSWDGPGPSFWMNTGNNNSPLPGNGWQNMNTTSLMTLTGNQTISTTGQANSNAGYYCIGIQETYTPSESYNTHNSQWTEFNGVIRSFSVS
jgi:hypothetical protein